MSYSFIAYLVLLFCLALIPLRAAHAEGSWQMGLFEGISYRQPIYETNVASKRNILYVDILSAGEVINVLACGTANSHSIRVQIYDPFNANVYDDTATGNVDCASDFNTTFDPVSNNAHQHVTTTTGTYKVHLTNNSASQLDRYDVTVTNSVTDTIDPRENGGRLWSDYWYFWAGSFAESRSTDADLYVVADGGFVGTYFIWKLDLTNFAGYGYGLKANDLGVDSPNSAGDIVAGISVPSSGNSVTQKYPIYLSYPAKNYPTPSQSFTVSDLEFKDSDSTDNAITASGNGAFSFTTDITTTGVYEIIIDNSAPGGGAPDGIFGQGDIYLRGAANPGTNTIPWDGKDNNGNTIPLGAYSAQLSLRSGEFHFVADDVETSGGPSNPGLKIYRANANGNDSPTAVYWDDSTVLGSTEPNAFNQTGLYDGDHNWGQFNSGGIGNSTLIDTYAFAVNVTPNPTPIAVVEDDTALASIIKSFVPDTIVYGGVSNMQFEISNPGTQALTGISVSDTMPLGMTLITNPASISVTGVGCSGFTFSPDTVVGGNILNIVDGNMDAQSVCVVSADITAVTPGELVNSTSGVTANELSFGVPSNNASLFITPEASGTPMQCDATMYESETVGTSTRLYQINTAVTPFSRTEFNGANYAPSGSYRHTALAYNPADNYLYAIVTESDGGLGDPVTGSVLRIDNDGKVVNLGYPEAGPNTMKMPVVSDRFVGGTMTTEGKFVVVTDNSATSNTGASIPAGERGLILEIDVTQNTPQVLFNWRHGRNVGDIAGHADGRLLSHTSTEGLISIDSETGNVVTIGGNVNVDISSLMANSLGQLYAHTQSTGELLMIDPDTGNGSVLNPLNGGATSDGAACAYGIGIQKSVSLTELKPGDTASYQVLVVNGGSTTVNLDFSDNLVDSRTFVSGSLNNPLGGTINNYADTNLLTITGASLGANSTATITFDVLFPPATGAGESLNQAQVQVDSQALVVSDYPTTQAIGDPTPINVLPVPGIGISKRSAASGTEISYWFTLVNTGVGRLDDLSLSDDLDLVFGSGNYSVVGLPVAESDPGTITLNSAFTGSGGGTAIIDEASSSFLEEGAQAIIRLTINVATLSDMGAGFGVYSNQVEVFATTQTNDRISDLSVNGDNVDPDNNGVADDQSPTVVSIQAAFSVSGLVFEDNGLAGAVAHDAIKADTENALRGVTVELRDSSNNLINSTQTASAGNYELSIPIAFDGTTISVETRPTVGYLSISEAANVPTTGTVTDSKITFTADTATSASYRIDFGRIKEPGWLKNSVVENSPGTVALHPHQYRPNSSGAVSFSYSSTDSSSGNTNYSAVLFVDKNCDGRLDYDDDVAPASIAVSAGGSEQIVCVINKIIIPANAVNNDTYTTSIKATLTYFDPLPSGHALSSVQELIDITRTIASGEGVLVLTKSVRNISTGSVETTANIANPDDVLRYRVNFNNNGTGPVTEVLIADGTPAYSILEVAVQCPATLPDGIIACQVLLPTGTNNASGYQGPVRWQFDGALSAGAQGTVSFDVRVE